MNIPAYFDEQGIPQYAVCELGRFSAEGVREITRYLPGCQTALVFGKPLPKACFHLDPKVQTHYFMKTAKMLDDIAFDLSDRLTQEGHFTVPVVTYAPVRVERGAIRGLLSIKHLAAQAGLGSLGMNTVLINGEYGNRLLLSGALCVDPLPTVSRCRNAHCTQCRQCVTSCPTAAVSENQVDMIRCVNLRRLTPNWLRPFLKALLRSERLGKYWELAMNVLATGGESVCSRCLTACPHFNQ